MKKYTIRISLNGYKDDLYRVITMDGNATLADLGYVIVSIFNSKGYLLFKFLNKNISYVCDLDSEFEDYPLSLHEYVYASDYKISDALNDNNKTLEFIYHYSDEARFDVELVSIEETEDVNTKILDGKGYGFFEDNIDLVRNYLDRKHHDFKGGKYTMGNLPYDFEAFDVEKQNIELSDDFIKIKENYEN